MKHKTFGRKSCSYFELSVFIEDCNDHRENFLYPKRSFTLTAAPELISPTQSSGTSMKGEGKRMTSVQLAGSWPRNLTIPARALNPQVFWDKVVIMCPRCLSPVEASTTIAGAVETRTFHEEVTFTYRGSLSHTRCIRNQAISSFRKRSSQFDAILRYSGKASSILCQTVSSRQGILFPPCAALYRKI